MHLVERKQQNGEESGIGFDTLLIYWDPVCVSTHASVSKVYLINTAWQCPADTHLRTRETILTWEATVSRGALRNKGSELKNTVTKRRCEITQLK